MTGVKIHLASQAAELFPTGCERSCDDIDNPALRAACEEDMELTGNPSWACQPTYVNPIITEPTAPPCYDSTLFYRTFKKNGKPVRGYCSDVANAHTKSQCANNPGVSEACPQTRQSCGICADVPSNIMFRLDDIQAGNKWKNCDRVDEDTTNRCPRVQNACRATCGIIYEEKIRLNKCSIVSAKLSDLLM